MSSPKEISRGSSGRPDSVAPGARSHPASQLRNFSEDIVPVGFLPNLRAVRGCWSLVSGSSPALSKDHLAVTRAYCLLRFCVVGSDSLSAGRPGLRSATLRRSRRQRTAANGYKSRLGIDVRLYQQCFRVAISRGRHEAAIAYFNRPAGPRTGRSASWDRKPIHGHAAQWPFAGPPLISVAVAPLTKSESPRWARIGLLKGGQ